MKSFICYWIVPLVSCADTDSLSVLPPAPPKATRNCTGLQLRRPQQCSSASLFDLFTKTYVDNLKKDREQREARNEENHLSILSSQAKIRRRQKDFDDADRADIARRKEQRDKILHDRRDRAADLVVDAAQDFGLLRDEALENMEQVEDEAAALGNDMEELLLEEERRNEQGVRVSSVIAEKRQEVVDEVAKEVENAATESSNQDSYNVNIQPSQTVIDEMNEKHRVQQDALQQHRQEAILEESGDRQQELNRRRRELENQARLIDLGAEADQLFFNRVAVRKLKRVVRNGNVVYEK